MPQPYEEAPRERVGVKIRTLDDSTEVPQQVADERPPVLSQGEEVKIQQPEVDTVKQEADMSAMRLPKVEDIDFDEFDKVAGLKLGKILELITPGKGGYSRDPIKNYIKQKTEDDTTILEEHREVKKSEPPKAMTPEEKSDQLERMVQLTEKNKYIMYDKEGKPNYRPRNDLPEGNIFNLKDIKDGDDIDAAIQAMAEHLQPAIQKSRRGGDDGVMHDDAMRELAKELVLDPARMREVLLRPDGTTANTEEIYAMSMLYRQHAAKLSAAQKKAKMAGSTQEDIDTWFDLFQTQSVLLRKFMGYRAEWGRTGRSFNMAKSDMDEDITMTDQDFINLAVNGYDSNTLLKMMPEIDTAQGATYGMMFMKGLSKLNKMASEWFVKSILSGVHTQAINAIGVSSELGISIVDKFIAEQGTKAWIKMGGAYTPGMIAPGETAALLQGEVLSMRQALKTAFEVMKTSHTYDGGKFIPDETTFRHDNKIVDSILRVADTANAGFMTSRVMGGVDAFGKVIGEQGQYAALAFRKAYQDTQTLSTEGLNPLKANHYFETRLEHYLQHPTPDMIEEARYYGKRVTYQDKTYVGDLMAKGRDIPMFNFFVPFINTPLSSFLKNFLERLPGVGFLVPSTTAYLRQRPMSASEMQMSAARQITGGAIIATMYMIAENGQLQGSRPDWKTTKGRQEYDVWMAQKRMEMAIVSDADWQMQIKRIEQITYLAQTVADLRQLSIDKDYEYTLEETEAADRLQDYANSLTKSLMQNMEDKTFLQGLNMFFEGIDKGYGRFFEGVAVGLTPASGIRRNLTDLFFVDEVKVKETLEDKITANLLWLSKNLPNKLDIFGRPFEKNAKLTPIKYGEMQAKISPLSKVEEKKQTVILDLMYSMSQTLHNVPFGVPNKIHSGVKLESKDYHDYVEFARSQLVIDGKTFTETIYDLITSSEFRELSRIAPGDLEGMATEETSARSKFGALQYVAREWDDAAMSLFLYGRMDSDARRVDGKPIVPNTELLRKMNKQQRIKFKKAQGVNPKIGEE